MFLCKSTSQGRFLRLLPFLLFLIPTLAFSAPVKTVNEPDLKLDGYIMIEPVTIKAPIQPLKPKIYADKNARMYQSAGTTTLYKKDFGAAFTFEDILYKYCPFGLNSNSMAGGQAGKQVFLRQIPPSVNGGHTEMIGGKATFVVDLRLEPALIVLDNTPIGKSYETIAQLPVSQIASVTFLRGPQGFAMYGTKAVGGVVFVTTKMGSGYSEEEFDKMYEERRTDDLMKQIRLFRTETEFYIPAKEQVVNDPSYQFRSTILWQDRVIVDSTGTVKIRYPNNMVKGTALVFVNGISVANLPGSASFRYVVH